MYTNFLFLLKVLTQTKANNKKDILDKIECPYCKTKQFTDMTSEEKFQTSDDSLIPVESNLYCECINCKKPFIITAEAKVKISAKKLEITT